MDKPTLYPLSSAKLASALALCLALVACNNPEASPADIPASVEQAMAQCDKLPDPSPTGESAAERANAISQGQAARAACKKAISASPQEKANTDLARIREIMEKEEANRNASKLSEEQWKAGIKEGGKQPIKEYKY